MKYGGRGSESLSITPIHSGRTQQGASAFVMKTTVKLDVPSNGRIEILTTRRDPIDYSTLQAFRIVRSGTRGTLLDLC
jgi:hypothetical protein